MAYTSGRTVKTSRPAAPSTPRTATRDARKLVTRHLPNLTGVTIDSRLSYDLVNAQSTVRTVITYPNGTDYRNLAAAVEDLTGFISATPAVTCLTVTRTA